MRLSNPEKSGFEPEKFSPTPPVLSPEQQFQEIKDPKSDMEALGRNRNSLSKLLKEAGF